MPKVVIIGAGTWGLALANQLVINNDVFIWSFNQKEISNLIASRSHPKLPNFLLNKDIHLSCDLEILHDCDYVLIAVPSFATRSIISKISNYLNKQTIIIASKGIENETLLTLSEVVFDILGTKNEVVVISGPTHAEEVCLNIPTAIVSSSRNINAAYQVASLFNHTCLHFFINYDIKSVEICGAFKNIVALLIGISNGLGYGDNTKSALVTRGLFEIKQLGIKMGCMEETFSGLAGLGDLIVTSYSEHSRNNLCGYYIGKGFSVEESVQKVGMVVESLNSLPAAVSLSKMYDVDMPLVSCVNKIVNGASPRECLDLLIHSKVKNEFDKDINDIIFEKKIIEKQRNNNMRRVITYGTFDLLHFGHINLLKRAKALGDYLIVCLSTDEFNWNEKQKKCYFTYEQRKALLEALRYVDLVIPEENWNQKRSDMHEYHVDTFVIGDDWEGKFDFLKEEGVEVVYLPRTPEISSTKMKNDLNGKGNNEESKLSHDDINTNPSN